MYCVPCACVHRPCGPRACQLCEHHHNLREGKACALPHARRSPGAVDLTSVSPGEDATEVHVAAGYSDALMDVAPLGDRLVIFFSDLRVPHEVLPVTRRDGGARTACTMWYCGSGAGADAGRGEAGSVLLPSATATAGGDLTAAACA